MSFYNQGPPGLGSTNSFHNNNSGQYPGNPAGAGGPAYNPQMGGPVMVKPPRPEDDESDDSSSDSDDSDSDDSTDSDDSSSDDSSDEESSTTATTTGTGTTATGTASTAQPGLQKKVSFAPQGQPQAPAYAQGQSNVFIPGQGSQRQSFSQAPPAQHYPNPHQQQQQESSDDSDSDDSDSDSDSDDSSDEETESTTTTTSRQTGTTESSGTTTTSGSGSTKSRSSGSGQSTTTTSSSGTSGSNRTDSSSGNETTTTSGGKTTGSRNTVSRRSDGEEESEDTTSSDDDDDETTTSEQTTTSNTTGTSTAPVGKPSSKRPSVAPRDSDMESVSSSTATDTKTEDKRPSREVSREQPPQSASSPVNARRSSERVQSVVRASAGDFDSDEEDEVVVKAPPPLKPQTEVPKKPEKPRKPAATEEHESRSSSQASGSQAAAATGSAAATNSPSDTSDSFVAAPADKQRGSAPPTPKNGSAAATPKGSGTGTPKSGTPKATTPKNEAAKRDKKPKTEKGSVSGAASSAASGQGSSTAGPTQSAVGGESRYENNSDNESEVYAGSVHSDSGDEGAARPQPTVEKVKPAPVMRRRKKITYAPTTVADTPIRPLDDAFLADREGPEDFTMRLVRLCAPEYTVIPRKMLLLAVESLGLRGSEAFSALGDKKEWTPLEAAKVLESIGTSMVIKQLNQEFRKREVSPGEVSRASCAEVFEQLRFFNAQFGEGVNIKLKALAGSLSLCVNDNDAALVTDLADRQVQVLLDDQSVLIQTPQSMQPTPVCHSDSKQVNGRYAQALQLAIWGATLMSAYQVPATENVDYRSVLNNLFSAPSRQEPGKMSLVVQRAIANITQAEARLQTLRVQQHAGPLLAAESKQKPVFRDAYALPAASVGGKSPYIPTMNAEGTHFHASLVNPDAIHVQLELLEVALPGEVIPPKAQRFVLVSEMDAHGNLLPAVRVDGTPAKDIADANWEFPAPKDKTAPPRNTVHVYGSPSDYVYVEVCYELPRGEVPTGERSVPIGADPNADSEIACLAFGTMKLGDVTKDGEVSLYLAGGTFIHRRALQKPEGTASCFCMKGPPASQLQVRVSVENAAPMGFDATVYPNRFVVPLPQLQLLGDIRTAFMWEVYYHGSNCFSVLNDSKMKLVASLVTDPAQLEEFSSHWWRATADARTAKEPVPPKELKTDQEKEAWFLEDAKTQRNARVPKLQVVLYEFVSLVVLLADPELARKTMRLSAEDPVKQIQMDVADDEIAPLVI